MNRRAFIRTTSVLTSGLMFSSVGWAAETGFPVVRRPKAKRNFRSEAVEAVIQKVQSTIGNKELAWMFGNCYPNTLDTTVDFTMADGRPDTYVITGDIHAMWLRDSSAQVWPYLPLIKQDQRLRELIGGVINRQSRCILIDPYANAFCKDPKEISAHHKSDLTEMKPGVFERKWEVDSLCYPLRLAYGYWKSSKDTSPFDATWHKAALSILDTFRVQQRKHGHGPYHFQRKSVYATNAVADHGYGRPARPVGMIYSMFRPSDDATVFPFLVPSNYFAVVSLRQAAELLEQVCRDPEHAAQCRQLADEIHRALQQYAIYTDWNGDRVFAYEVDAYGSRLCMDDSNVPDLLSLPYLNATPRSDPTYEATRRLTWSDANPYFFKGKAAEGMGGPHVGSAMIWPMSIIMRALTSNEDGEIAHCLQILQTTHAGTGFMHESFNKDNPRKYSRSWFAWANSLFGELILKVFNKRPYLLN